MIKVPVISFQSWHSYKVCPLVACVVKRTKLQCFDFVKGFCFPLRPAYGLMKLSTCFNFIYGISIFCFKSLNAEIPLLRFYDLYFITSFCGARLVSIGDWMKLWYKLFYWNHWNIMIINSFFLFKPENLLAGQEIM